MITPARCGVYDVSVALMATNHIDHDGAQWRMATARLHVVTRAQQRVRARVVHVYAVQASASFTVLRAATR